MSYDRKPNYEKKYDRDFPEKRPYEGKEVRFPERKHYDDRPPKHYDDRPARHYDDRPPKHYDDRPPKHYDDRPPKHFEDRPPRHYDDRPPRRFDDRPARPPRAIEDRPPMPERRHYEDRIPMPERRHFEDRPPMPERRHFEDRIPAPRRFDDELPMNRPENEEPENILAGRNPIREALKAGKSLEKLLVLKGELSGSAREIVAKAHEAGIVVQEVEKSRLDEIYPSHQGMIAFTSGAEYSTLDEVFADAEEKGEAPFLIILDGITDPHNLGAIIRSAECVGAHGVIIPERRSVGLTPAAVKASAGACEYMKTVKVGNINRTIDELKERGVWIAGAAMDGDNAFAADLTGPIALVVGAEGDGISELTMKKCDLKLSLPMKGHIDSLNASVAAGVLMYAVMNARNK